MTETGGGSDTRVPVVYVAGSGRSGSTLFERALCTQPGWFGVGELRYVWRAGFLNDERCGCGEFFSACPFWAEVVARSPVSGPEATATAAEVSVHESRRDLAAAVLRRTRGAPSAPAAGTEYARRLRSLCDAVVASSGCEALVNSSKSPAHGRLLMHALGRPVHVVHLVRDSRAVAFAWTKATVNPGKRDGRLMPQYPPTRVARDWVIDNLLAESLARGAASYQRVRYEDFVADPAAVLADVVRRVGGAGPRLAVDGTTVELGTDHTVHGNPMRFATGRLEIRRDDQWRSALPATSRRAVSTLTGPLLLRYGYPLSLTRAAASVPGGR